MVIQTQTKKTDADKNINMKRANDKLLPQNGTNITNINKKKTNADINIIKMKRATYNRSLPGFLQSGTVMTVSIVKGS